MNWSKLKSRLVCVALLAPTMLYAQSEQTAKPQPAPEIIPQVRSSFTLPRQTTRDGASLPAPSNDFPDIAEAATDVQPIDWPSVLELARASNIDIKLATERICEAQLSQELAELQWIPNLYLGVNWMHHDGRVQDIPGQIFDASKSSLQAGALLSLDFQPTKVCVDILRAKQQVTVKRGAHDRVSRQTLQDASMAYMDMVATQGASVIALEVYELIKDLEQRSNELLRKQLIAEVQVLNIQIQLNNQQFQLLSTKEKQLGASERLAQLLNLPPGTRLTSAERLLLPITLVDPQIPDEHLITLAQSQGPGITEVEVLLRSLDEQLRQAKRMSLIPNFQLNVGGGLMGGGVGGTYGAWADQYDYQARIYWDVSRLLSGNKTQEIFDSKRRQTVLERENLRQKLGHGVLIFRDQSRKAYERILHANEQVKQATRNYKLIREALQAASVQELTRNSQLNANVMLAISGLASARANFLAATIEFNKAQIQLQYLIGVENIPAACAQKSVGLPVSVGIQQQQSVNREIAKPAELKPLDENAGLDTNKSDSEPTVAPKPTADESGKNPPTSLRSQSLPIGVVNSVSNSPAVILTDARVETSVPPINSTSNAIPAMSTGLTSRNVERAHVPAAAANSTTSATTSNRSAPPMAAHAAGNNVRQDEGIGGMESVGASNQPSKDGKRTLPAAVRHRISVSRR